MKPLTHMDVAMQRLPFAGRRLVYAHTGDSWEEETATLPFPLRRLRRRYRAFADRFVRPLALAGDLNPYGLDKDALFREYARQGFAAEILPWPVGTMKLGVLPWWGLHLVLKVEELCAACGGIGLMLLAHDLGFAPLLISGSMRAFFDWTWPIYSKLRRGEKAVMAFAITEPMAGSDVEETEGALGAKVVTRVRRVPGGYLLNGRKVFISDGAVADYVTVFACLENEGVESWTCFMVERGMKGFSLGRQELKMGQKAGDATELVFEDVFLPEKHRIGPERAGWAINRNVLNTSRPAVGAIALGIARGAVENCLEFCRRTRLGPKRLFEFQEVRMELAEMSIQLAASRALIWDTQTRYFMRPKPSASCTAKVFCSDRAVEICARAMAIMGDHAYTHGQGVEKSLRDARLTQIYEGTNQINRLGIVEDLWERDPMPTAAGSAP